MPIELGIDMDNVLNDFSNHFLMYAEKFGFKVNKNLINKNYDLKTCFESIEIGNEAIEDIFGLSQFWSSLPIYKYANSVIQNLIDNPMVNVTIVTMPWESAPCSAVEKVKWLQFYFYRKMPDVILIKDKSKLTFLDYLIEDKPDYIRSCMRRGINTIKYNYDYNKDVSTIYEVNDWYEIEALMDKFIKLKTVQNEIVWDLKRYK